MSGDHLPTVPGSPPAKGGSMTVEQQTDAGAEPLLRVALALRSGEPLSPTEIELAASTLESVEARRRAVAARAAAALDRSIRQRQRRAEERRQRIVEAAATLRRVNPALSARSLAIRISKRPGFDDLAPRTIRAALRRTLGASA